MGQVKTHLLLNFPKNVLVLHTLPPLAHIHTCTVVTHTELKSQHERMYTSHMLLPLSKQPGRPGHGDITLWPHGDLTSQALDWWDFVLSHRRFHPGTSGAAHPAPLPT